MWRRHSCLHASFSALIVYSLLWTPVSNAKPASSSVQVDKAGLAIGMRGLPDKGCDMDELEVRVMLQH
jgi:hypothetical protein